MVTKWKIGDKIQNDWEIQDILGGPGKSGMGIIYLVYGHQEVRALKTLQDRFSSDMSARKRFEQEALSWVNLDVHQNVTQAHIVEYIDGMPFLHLEYVNGGDLSQWIGTPRLIGNLPQVLHFAIQFCDGMTHALSKGIRVHRDIKPQNCLITGDNTATLKVTDFGLAKTLDEVSLNIADAPASGAQLLVLSRTGMAAGTCTHMAPEQFDDAKSVDVRADIYAFGVMLFQMITGRLPFVGQTWQDFERLHKTQSPPKLPIENPKLETIIQTCLTKDPSRRYPDFQEVRQELAGIYHVVAGEPAPEPVTGQALTELQLSNKGNSLYILKKYNDAVACFDQVLDLNPQNWSIWVSKANVLKSQRQFSDALACLERAEAANTTAEHMEFIWWARGDVLGLLQRREEALTYYDRALVLDPKLDLCWQSKAYTLSEIGRHAEAVDCYAHVVAIDPKNANAWLARAEILRKLGREAEAVPCYDRVITLQPGNYIAWANKGVALAAIKGQEQPTEPLACLDRALALNPREGQIWYTKAMLLIFFKNESEAMSCFAQAHKLGHPNAAVMIAALQQRGAEAASTGSSSNIKPEPQKASLVGQRDIAPDQALKMSPSNENSHTPAQESPRPSADGQGKNRNWLGTAGGWILVAVGAPLSLIGVLVTLLFMFSGTSDTSGTSDRAAGVIGALIICAGPFLLVGLPLLAIGSFILIRRARNKNKVQ